MTAAAIARAENRHSRFYVVMAWLCALLAIVGFTPSFWAPLATGRFAAAPVVVLHGLLFSAWMVFFIVQATLVAGGRVARHRSLGLLGIALATAMLFVGIMTALNSVRLSAPGFDAQNRSFAIVPISTVVFFVCVVAAAIANVTRPEVHKRLMLVATISLLPPAIARLIALGAGLPFTPGQSPPIVFSLAPSFASDLLLIAAMVWDWRTHGRVHRSYLAAGSCLLALQIVRVPLASSAPWQEFTRWLQAFGG
jgi:hypothetical protein